MRKGIKTKKEFLVFCNETIKSYEIPASDLYIEFLFPATITLRRLNDVYDCGCMYEHRDYHGEETQSKIQKNVEKFERWLNEFKELKTVTIVTKEHKVKAEKIRNLKETKVTITEHPCGLKIETYVNKSLNFFQIIATYMGVKEIYPVNDKVTSNVVKHEIKNKYINITKEKK